MNMVVRYIFVTRGARLILRSNKHFTLKNIRIFCNKVDTVNKSQNEDESDIDYVMPTTREITSKFKKYSKIPHNTPFMKNVFLGNFEKEMLKFPDFPNNEELKTLNNFVQLIDKLFKEKVDSAFIEKNKYIPSDVLNALASCGIFGLQIPLEYGGLNITSSKYCRLAEVIAQDPSVSLTVAAHSAFASMAILKHGTEEQKSYYLPLLASGRCLGAFCLTEPNCGSDIASIQSQATLSTDGKYYTLNGTKSWVINGNISNILIAFAKTSEPTDQGESTKKLTAFIVEKNFDGIKVLPQSKRFGVHGADICDVTFENTHVPVGNVLGNCDQGFKVAVETLNYGRYHMGSAGPGLMKKLIGNCISHLTNTKRFGTNLYKYKMLKEKLANMAVRTYVMESMAYLTSMNIDEYEYPDMSVEAAIVKIFNSENLWDCLNEVMHIFGASGLDGDLPYERHLRDSRVALLFEGTNEILRLYIALTCLKHAGQELKYLILKRRDFLNNPKEHFQHIWKVARMKSSTPKLNLFLHDEVHLNLKEVADCLEQNVLRLAFAVEEMFTRYGKELLNEQLVLRRFADIAILLYAMTACISHSNHSICIGLQNNDDEIRMTQIFCKEAGIKLNQLFTELLDGSTENSDDDRMIIADKLLKRQCYTPHHPMSRNW